MLLTDYTTVDEVCATLGVSSTEITDAILLQTRWTFQASCLGRRISNANMPDMYTTVAAMPANTRTKEQQRYYDLVRIFMCYSICQELVAAPPMFSVQTLTDGKVSFTRFAAAYAPKPLPPTWVCLIAYVIVWELFMSHWCQELS